MATAGPVFKGPGPQANGLQATAEGLWVCDQQDNHFYLVQYEDGLALAKFPSPARNLSGITAGGGLIWGASNVRPSTVYGHDPKTGWCVIALILPAPYEGGIHGLEYHDGALWVTRPGLRTIQQLNAETGELLHEIPYPASRSHGIYWDERTLVCVETNNHVVYRLDSKDGTVLEQYTIDEFEPHGMTRSADGRIWICDATTNRIALVER